MADTATTGQNAPGPILLVHDDVVERRALHLLLAGGGHRVKAYAVDSALLRDPGMKEGICLVAVHRQPHLDGIELLRQLRATCWDRPAILIASGNIAAIEPCARNVGYAHIVLQPFARHVLLGLIAGLLGDGRG